MNLHDIEHYDKVRDLDRGPAGLTQPLTQHRGSTSAVTFVKLGIGLQDPTLEMICS